MRIVAVELAQWLSVGFMAYKSSQYIGIVNIIAAWMFSEDFEKWVY